MGFPNVAIGVQTITARDLEKALKRGKRLHTFGIGWVHLGKSVSRELADAALGHVLVLGGRSGFRRVGR